MLPHSSIRRCPMSSHPPLSSWMASRRGCHCPRRTSSSCRFSQMMPDPLGNRSQPAEALGSESQLKEGFLTLPAVAPVLP